MSSEFFRATLVKLYLPVTYHSLTPQGNGAVLVLKSRQPSPDIHKCTFG